MTFFPSFFTDQNREKKLPGESFLCLRFHECLGSLQKLEVSSYLINSVLHCARGLMDPVVCKIVVWSTDKKCL